MVVLVVVLDRDEAEDHGIWARGRMEALFDAKTGLSDIARQLQPATAQHVV